MEKTLSEAAQEILKKNVAQKQSQGEKFGQGKELNTCCDKEQEVGNPAEGKPVINAPTATPPGVKPAADTKAPMEKIKNDPALKGSVTENEDEEDYEEPEDEDEEDESYNEDIDALMAGENLSEDFKRKATAIFEAAVKAKVEELATELEDKYIAQFEEAYVEMKEDLTTKVDDYLYYVAEEWVSENKLAVEVGLKTELTESFISSLKAVFEEHYIDIPEDRVDVVEELASKVEALESQIDEEIRKNISLKNQLSEQHKAEIVNSVIEGLTLTQQEKIKSIAESVEFVDAVNYRYQLESIKESYFNRDSVKPAHKSSLEDVIEINEETDQKIIDPIIAAYASKISQTVFK